MVSLIDIVPLTATVKVGGQEIEVTGIDVAAIGQLLHRFPDLAKAFQGFKIAPQQIVALGVDVVAAIIAAGCGSAGDAAAERAAKRFPVGLQLEFLTKILKVTLPNGASAFLEQFGELTALFGDIEKAPALKSRKASKI